jgi:hypothetical protein
MAFLLLLAALAITGTGVWMSRRWRLAGQSMMAVGALGLIGVIGLQVRQNVFPPQPTVRRAEMAVSYCLANCLLEDSAGGSGKVILLFPQRRVMGEDLEQSYEDGFVAPLRHGRRKLSLKAVRLEGANGDLSAFKQALDQNEEAMAFVSYAGVPSGFETLFAPEQSNMPAFFVFDAEGTTHWLRALKEGRIKAVALPRPGSDAHSRETSAGMPEQIFDRFYLLATPANADEIAASLKAH